MTELLALEDLSVSYGTHEGPLPAVRGVDLVVRAGEVVGVAGESGCGKSTLASTVLRLQPKSATVSGTVRVLGSDVLTMSWGDLRALRWAGASIVFQGALHSLNPVQRVERQIAEAITAHEAGLSDDVLHERVGELLEQVGLPRARMRTYPHQLSGGQRQRVMIAMALACRPSLIVADEPTTALDVMVQAQILDLLSGLVRDLGVGMMIISHDLSVLADVCDRVAVMYAGRIVEVGSAEQIFTDPQHPYTRALSGAFPRIGDQAARYAPAGLAGDPPDPRELPTGCSFAPRCPRAVDKCREAEPPLLPLADGRAAACVRVGGAVSFPQVNDDEQPLIEARGVFVDFVTRAGAVARALDGADLSVRRGEIVALVGESGSGKTTLARSLMGLQRPSGGEVFFDGIPLDYSIRGLRRFRNQVQMVLQDAAGSLNPRQTVYESVAEGIRLHDKVAGDSQGRTEVDLVSAAMSDAGLRPPDRLFLRYPHELSGGQKQRVLIAGALALRPQLLIADEPVSSLDASIRGEILALLLGLRKELGLGIVVVTHDLGLAWNIADRIAVMYLGRVVESGTTEEVLESPRHPYTKALLSVVPEIESLEPIVLTGEIPDPTRIPGGCRFHPRCPALADGTAAAAGVDQLCRGQALPTLPATGVHRVACHLDDALHPRG